MHRDRPRASRHDVDEAVREIREYHRQGRASLRAYPPPCRHGERILDHQADELGWNVTRLRKARQFADPVLGYSEVELNKLYSLLRQHRPIFGTAHIGILVTVPWDDGRRELQRLCLECNWSKAELTAEIKRRFGSRRQGGRRGMVSSDLVHLLVQFDEMTDGRVSSTLSRDESGTKSLLHNK